VKATLHDELMREAGFAAQPEESPTQHRSAVRTWLRSAILILFVLSLLLAGMLEIFGVPRGFPRALVWVLVPFFVIGLVGDIVRIERKR
jgi:UDP-N-acetylmuramyl pentapeptide phosphotransferase/UDP-N-acetylglucosamine-1-phosphate transferase